MLAIALATAGIGTGAWFFRSRSSPLPPAAASARAVLSALAREAVPSAPVALVAPAVQSEPERSAPGGERDENTTPRASAPASTLANSVPRAAPDAGDDLTLPVAAIPPDPAWRLDADQLAAYERLGRAFLSATASSEETTERLRRQWTEARRASDAQFEQMFGTELLATQQHRAAVDPTAAGH